MPAVPRIRQAHAPPVGDRDRGQAFALLGRQVQRGRRQHPDIGIQAQLVAGVPRGHRPAARLAHVADIEAAPARLLCGLRQAHQEIHQVGMAPVAVPGQAHRLPAWPAFGQLDKALALRDARARPRIAAGLEEAHHEGTGLVLDVVDPPVRHLWLSWYSRDLVPCIVAVSYLSDVISDEETCRRQLRHSRKSRLAFPGFLCACSKLG